MEHRSPSQHPEWFIGEEETNFEGNDARPFVKFRLFNFGNPAARTIHDRFDVGPYYQSRASISIGRIAISRLAPFWSQIDSHRSRGNHARFAMSRVCWSFGMSCDGRHPQLILDIVQRGDLETISRAVDLSRADYPVSPDADPIGNQVSTEGLAYWRPHYGTILSRFARAITIISVADSLPGLRSLFSMRPAPRIRSGSFVPPDFPFDWLRNPGGAAQTRYAPTTTATTIRFHHVVKIRIALRHG